MSALWRDLGAAFHGVDPLAWPCAVRLLNGWFDGTALQVIALRFRGAQPVTRAEGSF